MKTTLGLSLLAAMFLGVSAYASDLTNVDMDNYSYLLRMNQVEKSSATDVDEDTYSYLLRMGQVNDGGTTRVITNNERQIDSSTYSSILRKARINKTQADEQD